MVNPHAKIYLDWSTLKDRDVEIVNNPEIDYIMGKDMNTPNNTYRHFGLYYINGETPANLAMTTWHWGKLYEKIVRIILNGTWKDDAAVTESRAINYWWGLSAGVVDLIYSRNLPKGTKRLVDLLHHNICSDILKPFSGDIVAQDGTVRNESDLVIPPKEIITMDWLVDNVEGSIPSVSELTEAALAVTKWQGLNKNMGENEKKSENIR